MHARLSESVAGHVRRAVLVAGTFVAVLMLSLTSTFPQAVALPHSQDESEWKEMAAIVRAYWLTRLKLFGDTAKLNVCGTTFRKFGQPLAGDSERLHRADTATAKKLVPCDALHRGAPQRFLEIHLESVDAKASIATVLTTVMRGEWLFHEEVRLTISPLPPQSWIIASLDITGVMHVTR